MSRPTGAHRIVVGVDRSFAGMQALRRATQLARRDGAQLDAVRAWVFAPTWRPGTLTWRWQDECDRAALVYLRGVFDAALGGMPRDVTVRLVATQGYAGQVLVDHAHRESDLLVGGSPVRPVPWPRHPVLRDACGRAGRRGARPELGAGRDDPPLRPRPRTIQSMTDAVAAPPVTAASATHVKGPTRPWTRPR